MLRFGVESGRGVADLVALVPVVLAAVGASMMQRRLLPRRPLSFEKTALKRVHRFVNYLVMRKTASRKTVRGAIR